MQLGSLRIEKKRWKGHLCKNCLDISPVATALGSRNCPGLGCSSTWCHRWWLPRGYIVGAGKSSPEIFTSLCVKSAVLLTSRLRWQMWNWGDDSPHLVIQAEHWCSPAFLWHLRGVPLLLWRKVNSECLSRSQYCYGVYQTFFTTAGAEDWVETVELKLRVENSGKGRFLPQRALSSSWGWMTCAKRDVTTNIYSKGQQNTSVLVGNIKSWPLAII